ncbi:hypothetical protein [Lentilactobacillus rapi]|nr:hypothetical protein [Lentilactobacillus rapi]
MSHWETDEQPLIKQAISSVDPTEWQGLVQVLFDQSGSEYTCTGIRPVRITETAFLTKTTGVNWINVLVRKYLGLLDMESLREQLRPAEHKRYSIMTAKFPFKELQSNRQEGTTKQEVGASLSFKNFE